MLLGPFGVEVVAQEHVGGLAAVAGRYGEDWTRAVVDGLFGPGHSYTAGRPEWVDTTLPGLCETLRATGSPEVARLLAARAWTWLADQLQLWTTTARSDSRLRQLEMLSSPLVRLLEAADDTLRDEIAGALREYGDNVLECLMPALRLAHTRRAEGLDTIARDCADRLRAIIAQPPRDADDWSIDWSGDGCELCDTLGTFLGSRSGRIFEWPLAASGRAHVHGLIDSADLPVRHETRRRGRPYTLVLTKTDELFTRATDARHKAETDLAWLTSTRGVASAK
jgi:hypothetical protein